MSSNTSPRAAAPSTPAPIVSPPTAAATSSPLPRLLKVEEVCAALQVRRSTLYNWLDKGLIKGVKIGSARRFKLAEIEALIEQGGAS